jgi:hypothetical protein
LRAAVVISEVHYDPPDGPASEFIEIENAGLEAVDLDGWAFTGGVQFSFPAGTSLEPHGFLIVVRDPSVWRVRGLPVAKVLGPFSGSLDNGGERVELSNATARVVDSVRYDDDAPWDERAAGGGTSLQRICASADGGTANNWSGAGDPTPLAPSAEARCPPPAPANPAIAFNEVHFHGPNVLDAQQEFVELRNNSNAPVNLKGYELAGGVKYKFDVDTVLAPGDLIAVCRDAAYVRDTLGSPRTAGNFTGVLSNQGERITLVDASGGFVDSVRYGDGEEWSVSADGLGASLEKVLPQAPSDDPRSWAPSTSPAAANRQRVVLRGKATSSIIIFKLDGSGQCLIDNLSLVDLESPATNLIPQGNFDRGIGIVNFEGSHFASSWDPTGGVDGKGALRLRSKTFPGAKPGGVPIPGAEPSRGWIDLAGAVRVNGPTYELAFDFAFASGWRGLTVSFVGSSAEQGIYWRFDSKPSATPGRPNSVLADRLAPRVSGVSRWPREPSSTDNVTITARVAAGAPIASVRLSYQVDGQEPAATVDCLDDGAHGDGEAGDGVFGVTLPQQVHNSAVTFQIRAEDTAGGVGLWPKADDPTGVDGYYVNDLRPSSKLAIHQILLQHKSIQTPRRVIDQLDCEHYWTGAFAFRGDLYPRVGVRMRGISVCRTPKPYLKLRFQRGREFQAQRKLNYQAIWTDKSLVRERLSWEIFRDIGVACSRPEYVRVHTNGKYYGLFTALENPDERMLRRNHLDPDGNLYKSVSSSEEPNGGDPGPWEKKTNEDGDHSDLKKFLREMNAAPIQQLRFYFAANLNEDRHIEYQLGQVLIDNLDYTGHNHFMFHDAANGKWFPIPWDLDLTFGKSGVFDDGEIIPGYSPWFGTSIEGEFQNFLLDRFFSDAGSWYRRAYLARLYDALHERFTEEYYSTRFNEIRGLIFEEQDEDIRMWGRLTDHGGGQFPRDFLSNLDRVRYYVTQRRSYLLNYVEQRANFTGHDRLKITELNYHPPGHADELEFLELWNPGRGAVDLTGWQVEGVGYTFPAGSRADANEVIILAKDPAAFAARYGGGRHVFGPYDGSLDNNGEVLRLKDHGVGHPVTVDYVRYGTDDGWPSEADGLGRTLELTQVSSWRYNELPENWRASAELGGSPGVIDGVTESRYRRGDVNSDRQTNLTDVLVTLGYLFLGVGEPPCRAAADVNGSGIIALDDAIFLLRHLFQGSPEPIPFPGPLDCAPSPVEACATSNCD